MPATPERVAAAYRLLKCETKSEQETYRLARLLGSRQELLAAMIVRENAFAGHAEVMQALLTAARMHYIAPRSPRPERGDALRPRRTALDAGSALVELVAGEAQCAAAAKAVHDAVRHQVHHWPVDAPHPGYQWCVNTEAKE